MKRGLLICFLLVGGVMGAHADEVPEDGFVPSPGLHDGLHARIETNLGRIVVRLFPEQAPQSVAHFAGLARGTIPWTDVETGEIHSTPYYDGVPVHKTEAMRRFEAGDRSGTGRRAPKLYVAPEGEGPANFSVGYRLGMTRAPGSRISAVQFFITVAPEPYLTGRHPCFGTVLEGREVVQRITEVKTYSNGRPIEPVIIEKIRIFTVGPEVELPEPVTYLPEPAKFELKGY